MEPAAFGTVTDPGDPCFHALSSPVDASRGFTVGKHEAADGSTPDPIVAEALAHRPTGAVHHAADAAETPATETPAAETPAAETPAAESPVGWPGAPAPEGGGLGWPADATAAPAPRGWRRLFGLSRVA